MGKSIKTVFSLVFMLSLVKMYELRRIYLKQEKSKTFVREYQIHPGNPFSLQIDIKLPEKLSVYELRTSQKLLWVHFTNNKLHGVAKNVKQSKQWICIGKIQGVCKLVVKLHITKSSLPRKRRATTSYPCRAGQKIVKIAIIINEVLDNMTSVVIARLQNYSRVPRSQIWMEKHSGAFLRPGDFENLANADIKFIASGGCKLHQGMKNHLLKYVFGCGTADRTKIAKLKQDFQDGSLTRILGYPACICFSVTALPNSSVVGQEEAPRVISSPSLSLQNSSFRSVYRVPATVFHDKEDGNTRNLSLYLYEESGNVLPISSWINLKNPEQQIRLYTSKAILSNQPSGGYKFRLSAIDSSGMENHTNIRVTLSGPISPANYQRTIRATSDNSVLVTSYKDVDIIFVLQSKMADYLKIAADDIATVVSRLTRSGNGRLSIEYTFSIRKLIGTQCDVQALVNIRNKMVGSAEVKFKDALKPQFIVTSLSKEEFKASCSHLSEKPPIIGITFKTQSIKVGKFFAIAVPSTVFLTPAGSNMRLEIHLRFLNNTVVPSNYWIGLSSEYLDQNVMIQGIASQSVAVTSTLQSFKLVALTPLYVESHQNIQFNIQAMTTRILFSVTLTQSSTATTTYINFVNSFVAYMSNYLNMASSSIILLNYQVTANAAVVTWTALELSQTPCNMQKINEVKTKLTSSNGGVNDSLRAGLTRAASFSPTSIAIKLSGGCNLPVVTYKIPQLDIPKYGTLSYVVPSNTFKDGNGNDIINLMLLEKDGRGLQPTSWIWFNRTSRLIAGFPFAATTTTIFSYILRASNNEGISADQNVSISLSWVAPQYHLSYLVQFAYDSSLLPVSNVITTFMHSLKTYFKKPLSMDIIINQTAFLTNNKIRLYYQNTSLRIDKCDVNPHLNIIGMLRRKSTQTAPNINFISAMQPLFQIEEVGVKLYGKCLVANRNQPVFNAANNEALNFFLDTKFVPYCGLSTFVVPEKLFYDEEEGYTRNLKLSLLDVNFNALPASNWVNLNSSYQTIVAIADDSTFKKGTADVLRLKATDSDNKWDNIRINFSPSGAKPLGYYNITMKMVLIGIGNQPYVLQMEKLFRDLQKLFPNGPSIHFRSYSVGNSGAATKATLIFSPCFTATGVCNTTAIRLLREAMFTPGTKKLNSKLSSIIDSHFQVTGATESIDGPCFEDGPILRKSIPTLKIRFCGPFSFKIPINTFSDNQDGNTAKLRLKFFYSNGTELAKTFWLQFDQSKQLITAVLTQAESAPGYAKQHYFVLVATDSTDLSVNTTVRVLIDGAMAPYSHTFTMQTRVTQPSDTHLLHSFATKLMGFLADTRSSFQAIRSVEAANNKWIITWSNCSMRYNPCDVLGLKNIKDSMQTATGHLKTSFQTYLAPEFNELFLSDTNLGPCLTNKPPTSAVKFGPILTSTCQTYKAKIPERTFNDYEQGNTRNLNLTVRNNNKWILFDSARQEITILATNQFAAGLTRNSVIITLIATDLSNQEARQDLEIKISLPTKPATQKISMQYRIASLSSQGSFTALYDAMRKNMIQYFSLTAVLTSVEYAKLPVDLQTGKILTAEWSSCSMPRDQCNNGLLNTMSTMIVSGGSVNAAFKKAMGQNIDVINTTFTKSGLCNDQTMQPVVQNPLPILNLSYCGYLVYQIPENTFYDKIDGNSRRLALSLVNATNKAVTEKWIYFDPQTQTITAVLTDSSIPVLTPPFVLNYKVKASTKRGMTVYDNLYFRIAKPQPNISFSIKINFAWIGRNPPVRNIILSTVLSRFAHYFGSSVNMFHFTSIQQEDGSTFPYFVVKIANCSAQYTPCDHNAIKATEKMLYNLQGTLPAFKSAMGSDVYVTYLQVLRSGPCSIKNTPPRVNKVPGKIQVHGCSDFNYTLPATTFVDEEDISLELSVTKVNGVPISGSYEWVFFISSDHTLYGIVTDQVLKNQPAGGYNLTVRATDSGGSFAETSLIVQIMGQTPQKLYQFVLQLTTANLGMNFMEERQVIMVLNSYFKSRFTNVISSTKSGKTLSVKASICTLPNKCDESAASANYNQMMTSNNKATAELSRAFSYRYVILSVTAQRDPVCLQPMNPPVPATKTLTIRGSYCGGLEYRIPSSLFVDPEDGDATKLSLVLYLESRTHPPKSHWVQLNSTSRIIYGWPSRDITLSSSAVKKTILVAKDRSGLESSISIKFSFTSHPEPKYTYHLVYKPILTYENKLSEMLSFTKLFKLYLKDSTANSVGLIRHTQSNRGVHFYDYANCSVSYSPCDLAALEHVKSLLFTKSNIATTKFKNAMKSAFVMNYGYTIKRNPCSGTANNPPRIVVRITSINITVNGKFEFRIPTNTFYDTEDGNTRKLTLALRDNTNSLLSSNFWMQFDATTQIIMARASSTLAMLQPKTGFSFILTATDSSKLSASNSFQAKIYGPVKPLTDCQIQLVFVADASLSSNNNNALIQRVYNGLSSFFELAQSEIGLVNFVRQSNTKFTISWSYFSPKYHKYISMTSSNTPFIPIDYQGTATRILMKLFKSDRKTVQTNFYSAFNQLTVHSVKTVFTGSCANFPPMVKPNITSLTYSIGNCGYRKETIQSDLFYDYEDGYTFSLNLKLLGTDFQPVASEGWINIDNTSESLLISLQDHQRQSKSSTFMFILRATDSAGKSTTLPIYVSKLQTSNTISPFNITFEFTVPNSVSDLYVNETIILSDTTAQLYSLKNGQSIMTQYYAAQYGPQVSRSFTWVTCQYQSCSSSAVLQKTKQLITPNLNVFQTFKQLFQSRKFTLQRLHYASSCNSPVMPPSFSSSLIQFNITMCKPLIYKLPFSTFVDSVDGEANNMKLQLLDDNKQPLPSTAWIKLNSATLELYAIFQSSMLQSSMTSSVTSQPRSLTNYFQLEATNSQGLKSYKRIKVNVLDFPYTSDCLVTLDVKREFGDDAVADLDVMYTLISAISSYYKDSTISIKVKKFQKTSSFSYSLIFSNCSFSFSTSKAAKVGLEESHRPAITKIFFQMINADKTAKAAFKRHLSSKGFILSSIKVSFSCIESPPHATIKELKSYAFLCREFNYYLPQNLFNDTRDGLGLRLSLRYTNGIEVSSNEWVQLDPTRRRVYGVLTHSVKMDAPGLTGYSYLLFATDSSGRSANISYNIRIANSATAQDVTFFLAFNSKFNEFTKTAEILSNVTRKISKYLSNRNMGEDIVIYKYNAIHLIQFKLCKLKCEPAAISNVARKLQKTQFKTEPSSAFQVAVGPEISPTYMFIHDPKCAAISNTVVTTTRYLRKDFAICGFLSYEIPSTVFSSSIGGSMKDLYLSMKTSTGEDLKSDSVIHFRPDAQRVEGIAVYSQLSSSMTYQISAVSAHSSTSSRATLQLDFLDYSAFASILPQLCTIKAAVKTMINQAFTDAYILKKFSEKVAKYFNSATQQVQIISYTKTNSDPSMFKIEFSNCSWFSLLQTHSNTGAYYQNVQTTLRRIFEYSGSINTGFTQAFSNSLKPEFNLVSVKTNQTICSQPPNEPPKAKKPLTNVTAAACGEFNYQIPVDFFSDEDGNSRALQLEMLNSDKTTLKADSWVVFNNITQAISGLPLNQALTTQPLDGFSYVFKATDKAGYIGYANLNIKINGKPFPKYNDMELNLFYGSAIKSFYQMDSILSITRKVSSFRTISDPLNRLRVVLVRFLPLSRIMISLVNCTQCSPYAMLKYSSLKQDHEAEFDQYMKPEFPLRSSMTARGKCTPGGENYANQSQGVVHNASFCGVTKINYMKILGIRQLLTGTKVAVRGVNFQPLPRNSWFWFNDTSNVLEAFANEAIWKSQPFNGTQFTWANIDSSTGLRVSAFMQDGLKIVGSPPSNGLQYSFTFDVTLSLSSVDAYYVSLVFRSLEMYLGRKDLQFVSLSRQQGSKSRLKVEILVCGLPSDCSQNDVKAVDNKIFESPGKLRKNFQEIFPNSLRVVTVSDNCKNQPPTILKKLNITIPICGLYRYKIPSDFASDFEDGNADKLSISLRTQNNNQLPRDSWLRFNETSHEIYSLPPESVVRASQITGWPFIIVVKDKGGKQAATNLTVYVSKDTDSYYKLSVSFDTKNSQQTVPYLDIQVEFLTKLSRVIASPLSTYRILSFHKTRSNRPDSESFFIQFGNCSVKKHVCASNEKSILTSMRIVTSGQTNQNSQLYREMSGSFRITSVKNESLYTLDHPPKVLNRFAVVRLDKCGMFVTDVPPATFYDEDQGPSDKLDIRLTFPNGTAPPPSYWMQLINNTVYIVPYGDITSGTYDMTLTATDRCGHSASTEVRTVLSSDTSRSVYRLRMRATTANMMSTIYAAYNIAKLKVALKDLFSDSRYLTKVTMYHINNNKINMAWEHCTVACDPKVIGETKTRLFLSAGIVNPNLTSRLRSYYAITNMTEEFLKNCTVPSTLPPVANRNISIEVPLCRKLNFTVPNETFFDPEEGGARSLLLSLVTESRQALSVTSWVQFDAQKQVIYGYPRVATNSVFQTTFKYLLIAKDREGNSVSTFVYLDIVGTLPRVLYQLSLSGQTTMDNNIPNVAQEISLMNKIGNVFNDYAINDIYYSRFGNSIQFSWSFCAMRIDRCDCYRIQEIQNKLLSSEDFNQRLLPEFSVNQTNEQLHGPCAMTQSPELRYDRNELMIQPGQIFTYVIPADKFYDYEDGFTSNLTLYAVDTNNMALGDAAWLKVQNNRICGIMTLVQLEQLDWLVLDKAKEYKIVARDRCGKETKDSFLVRLKTRVPKLSYRVTVHLSDSFGKNCSRMKEFVLKISTYLNANESDILVYNFTSYNMTNNASVIVWGLRNLTESNCRSDKVQIVREKILTNENEANQTFVDYMKPEFEVIKVKDQKSSSCTNTTVGVIPPIKTSFPWWILILLLILAILLLLCWLCWICVPRCCPGCCGRFCGCCGKCCQPGEKYSSLEDDDMAGKPQVEDGEQQVGGKDTEEDETMMCPPPYLIPNDPTAENFGFENEGPEDDGRPEDEGRPDDETDKPGGIPSNDSSGYPEEISFSDNEAEAESADSGVIEPDMQKEKATVQETTPFKIFSPPPTVVPPMYGISQDENQQKAGEIEKDSNSGYDRSADMAGEEREAEEDSAIRQSNAIESGSEDDYNNFDASQMTDNVLSSDNEEQVLGQSEDYVSLPDSGVASRALVDTDKIESSLTGVHSNWMNLESDDNHAELETDANQIQLDSGQIQSLDRRDNFEITNSNSDNVESWLNSMKQANEETLMVQESISKHESAMEFPLLILPTPQNNDTQPLKLPQPNVDFINPAPVSSPFSNNQTESLDIAESRKYSSVSAESDQQTRTTVMILPEVNPINPINPINTISPINSINPISTIDPINSINPINPVDPINPINPIGTINPIDPIKPIGTINPIDPSSPRDTINFIDTINSINPRETDTRTTAIRKSSFRSFQDSDFQNIQDEAIAFSEQQSGGMRSLPLAFDEQNDYSRNGKSINSPLDTYLEKRVFSTRKRSLTVNRRQSLQTPVVQDTYLERDLPSIGDGNEQRQSTTMQRSSGSFMNDEQSEKRIEISQETSNIPDTTISQRQSSPQEMESLTTYNLQPTQLPSTDRVAIRPERRASKPERRASRRKKGRRRLVDETQFESSQRGQRKSSYYDDYYDSDSILANYTTDVSLENPTSSHSMTSYNMRRGSASMATEKRRRTSNRRLGSGANFSNAIKYEMTSKEGSRSYENPAYDSDTYV